VNVQRAASARVNQSGATGLGRRLDDLPCAATTICSPCGQQVSDDRCIGRQARVLVNWRWVNETVYIQCLQDVAAGARDFALCIDVLNTDQPLAVMALRLEVARNSRCK